MSILNKMIEQTKNEIERATNRLAAELRTYERDLEAAQQAAALLADAYGTFLGAVVRADSPDAVLDHIDHDLYVKMAENGPHRKIDNIKLLRQRYHLGLGDCKQLVESLRFDVDMGRYSHEDY